MNKYLTIIQLVVALLLTVSILLQQRGAGTSAFMGGGGGSAYYAKRGFEKFLFGATIGLAIAFLATAILNLIV